MTNILEARKLRLRAASASGAALIALLLPKCPLCVAAYLAAIGVSAGVAQGAASWVRPLLFVIAGVSVVTLVSGAWRSRRRANARSCCKDP